MNIRFYKLLPIIFMPLSLTMSAPAQAGIKCWTNNEGIKECGTSVPPEFSQQGHHEVSKQGIIKEEVERVKTEEELREAAEQEKIALEKEAEQKERIRMDSVLLDTYIKVEDIELARDDNIAVVESNIKLANKLNEKIKKDIDRRIQSVDADKNAGREPSEKLLKDIESLKEQIAANEDHIARQRDEIDRIKEDYSKKISRFKELKNIN